VLAVSEQSETAAAMTAEIRRKADRNETKGGLGGVIWRGGRRYLEGWGAVALFPIMAPI
jgi:hypothetical protein